MHSRPRTSVPAVPTAVRAPGSGGPAGRSRWPICLLLAAAARPCDAQTVPAGFVVDTLVASGLSTPHDFCFLPDGRVLIANKAGDVCVFGGGNVVTIGTVPNVETSYERGLLSIAADPGFAGNGHVYVFYSHGGDAFLHVDRFTCVGDLSNPASTNLQFAAGSQRAVLGTLIDNSTNHNGGSLRFGPDQKLHLACGDDGIACNAQNPLSQAGWLLRFDVAGLPPGGSSVLPPFQTLDPGDNPLSANTDSTQLLLAHGLRNPWRMCIDPVTGNLYVGDVGLFNQDEISEYVRPGAGPLPLRNYGWPWREGTAAGVGCAGTQPPGLTAPIVTVPNGPWVAILAGPRYRSSGGVHAFGAAYDGCLFYADHVAGEVRRLVDVGGWIPAPAMPGQPTATEWGTGFPSITSLQQGPDGALWFTQHGGSGTLKRVRPLGPQNSIAAIDGNDQRTAAGEPFPRPLVVRVVDAQGNPLANGTVHFTVTGAGTLSTTNPVHTDAQGFAATTVSASPVGGAVQVTATTPGGIAAAPFGLFARKLTVTTTPQSVAMTVANVTNSVPPLVPYVVMVSFPGSPQLATPFGTLCIDPGYALALVIEDGFGLFGFVSFSGSGGIGAPGLQKVYAIPPALLAGQLLRFQAVGFDAQDGLFRTDCEVRQF